MYIPTAFREENSETLLAFMRAHSFATVISTIDGVPFATHIPVGVEQRGDTVIVTGHVSKANAHVRAFSTARAERIVGKSIDDMADVAISDTMSLVIFSGPHAYVSPSAYDALESVPTWNYIAVHATGVLHSVLFNETPEDIETMLDTMIAQYDPAYGAQWRDLPAKFRDGMMRGVVGFEMPVQQLEGKYKLSQNRSTHDQAAVQAMLATSDDVSARDVARAMQERRG
ncbi:MAG: FMN-binding negative transcriptional regulator [Gemmatimonadaceae bacterium]